jgi:DNA (cytosine-5)-methyltransferase 1
VWENVKGTFSSNDGEDFAAILQAFANIGGYRLEWQLLNTAWFLPQNRERIYLVGYSTTPTGDWGGVFPVGEEPRADNGIPRQQGNTCTLTTRYGADGNGSYITKRKQYAQEVKANYAYENLNKTIKKNPKAFKKGEVKAIDCYNQNVRDEAPCLTSPEHNTTRIYDGRVQPVQIGQSSQTFAHKSGTLIGEDGQDAFTIRSSNPNGVKVEQPVIGAIRGRNPENPNDNSKVIEYKQRFEYNKKGTSNALTSNPTINMVQETSYRIRRLTPIECERLQGFPDNHTEYGIYDGEVKKISNTQRYKQCGNAVTVDVVKAVAQQLIPIYNA